jgi:hypothetical protein
MNHLFTEIAAHGLELHSRSKSFGNDFSDCYAYQTRKKKEMLTERATERESSSAEEEHVQRRKTVYWRSLVFPSSLFKV